MSSIVLLADLKARCDWTFDADEDRAAPGYLIEASDLARSYGRLSWDEVTAPRMVKNIVIGAVRRFMRNPDGYITSRAGDEYVSWAENPTQAGSLVMTKEEIRLLKRLAGVQSLRSVEIVAWGNSPRGYNGTVPISGYDGEKGFPYFGHETEPW